MKESMVTVKRKASATGLFARDIVPYFRSNKELWDRLLKNEAIEIPKELMESNSAVKMYLEEITKQEQEESSEPVFRSFKKSRRAISADETENFKKEENE